MALIPLPHKPFPEAAQSFDSHLLRPLLRQQSAIAIKCSSGHGGYCPQPFKGCPLPIPLTVASAGRHDLAPALWPASTPTMLLLILSSAPRAAGALPSAQDGALAFPYLSAVGPDISSLERPSSWPQCPQSLARRLRMEPSVRIAGKGARLPPAPLRACLPQGPATQASSLLLLKEPRPALSLARSVSLSDDKKDWRTGLHQPGRQAGSTHLGTCRTRASWP